MSYDFKSKTSYSFQIYPSTILPSDFTACTVMSILDYDTAQSMSDVAAKHVLVYPYLPSGVSNDPKSYEYLKIKLADGSFTIIGAPWVREDTITVITSSVAVVKISNVAASDISKIKAALVSNGFSSIDISMQ